MMIRKIPSIIGTTGVQNIGTTGVPYPLKVTLERREV